MKKVFSLLSAVVAVVVLAGQASAATYTLDPWTYDPDNSGSVVSTATADGLRLEKNTPTATNAAAGATLEGVEGLSTTDLTLGFTVEGDGYCGAGAPRFNVKLSDGNTYFLGCAHGEADDNGTVFFEAGVDYGGVTLPGGLTVESINIVMDEEGQTTLSDITVNGQQVAFSAATNKELCKKGGWKTFSQEFKNQGQCVSYFMANPKAGKQL